MHTYAYSDKISYLPTNEDYAIKQIIVYSNTKLVTVYLALLPLYMLTAIIILSLIV